MADSYEWLDAERASTEVYANVIHPACICEWDLDKRDPSDEVSDLPAMKLIARRRHCVIHGVRGHV